MKTAAIIGISSYARHHLLIALEQMLQGRLRLVAATVVNQSEEEFFCRRLRGLGCEIFPSADLMWAKFAGRVDLCFIPTGIHLHAAMAIQALQAGSSCLVEKPLATSTDDARAIMQLERETGRFVAIGFQDLYAESTWTIKQQLLDGIIGPLRNVKFAGLWPRPAGYYRRNEWAGRLRHQEQAVFDSPINNAFAHFLNLALFWTGPTIDTSASVQQVTCELYRAQPIESFDTCCLRAALGTGVELNAYATHSCQEERVPRLRIQGAAGSLEWVQESHYEVTGPDGRCTRHAVPGKFETKLMMADAAVARLDYPATRICGTPIAFEHMRLVELLHASSSIIDLPLEYVRRHQTATGDWRAIVGIESAIDHAVAKRLLWSEIDVPWARPLVPLNDPTGLGIKRVAGVRRS